MKVKVFCRMNAERERLPANNVVLRKKAAQHLNALLEALQQAGVSLPEKALDRILHVLKHRGPARLFRALEKLPADIRE